MLGGLWPTQNKVVTSLLIREASDARTDGSRASRQTHTTVADSSRPCVASRGIYPLRMPEVSSVRAQWPVCGEQVDSGLGSSRPATDIRQGVHIDV